MTLILEPSSLFPERKQCLTTLSYNLIYTGLSVVSKPMHRTKAQAVTVFKNYNFKLRWSSLKLILSMQNVPYYFCSSI